MQITLKLLGGAAGILIAAFASAAVQGEASDRSLYRWIDAQGQLHLSDRPPGADVESEVLDTPRFAVPSLSPDEDPYSILNQARRLEQQRQAMARERQNAAREKREYELQRRQLELPTRGTQTESEVVPRIIGRRPILTAPRTRMPYQFPQRRGLWRDDHPAYSPYAQPRHRAWPRYSR